MEVSLSLLPRTLPVLNPVFGLLGNDNGLSCCPHRENGDICALFECELDHISRIWIPVRKNERRIKPKQRVSAHTHAQIVLYILRCLIMCVCINSSRCLYYLKTVTITFSTVYILLVLIIVANDGW